MISPLFQTMFVIYAHNLQVRGHETSNRTNTDRKKVGCHCSVHSEQLLLIGAQEATLKPGLLHSRWACKIPEARNSCFLLKAGRSSWGCMFGELLFLPCGDWHRFKEQGGNSVSELKGDWRLRALFGTDWPREVSALDAMI